jgi:hypothetical protein
LRSAKTVGVVSVRLSKTLIRPLFSATKTRPSEANRMAVGFVSPLKTTLSWKLAGRVDAPVAGPFDARIPSCGAVGVLVAASE